MAPRFKAAAAVAIVFLAAAIWAADAYEDSATSTWKDPLHGKSPRWYNPHGEHEYRRPRYYKLYHRKMYMSPMPPPEPDPSWRLPRYSKRRHQYPPSAPSFETDDYETSHRYQPEDETSHRYQTEDETSHRDKPEYEPSNHYSKPSYHYNPTYHYKSSHRDEHGL